MSKVKVVDHPLVKHKLALLRDKETDYSLFKQLVNELAVLMLYEATRELGTTMRAIETPQAPGEGEFLDGNVVFIPILRAGLGMLDSCMDMIPNATVGLVGMYRDDDLQPVEYYSKLPDLEDAKILILDPMLATGGSMSATIRKIKEKGGLDISVICLLASKDGIEKIRREHPDVDIYTAAIDDLDDRGNILPGLGDAGDRLFGTR